VIYVDDFKITGPQENHAVGWELLRKQLSIKPEKKVGGPAECMYLGCAIETTQERMPDGRLITFVRYRMEPALRSAVDKYLALAGPGFKLRHADTPFLVEDQMKSPQGAPCTTGSCVECPWCYHTFPPQVATDVKEFTGKRKSPAANNNENNKQQPQEEGRLQPIAAKILMTVLYTARCARLDLLRPICHLACHITRWSTECDRKLHRLMCYIHSTYHHRMVGWVGDDLDDVQPFLSFRRCRFRWLYRHPEVHDGVLPLHSRSEYLFSYHRGIQKAELRQPFHSGG